MTRMPRSTRVRSRKLLAVALALALASTAAHAQQTTSALQGLVVSVDGHPMVGADVIISHAPSGTISRATTDEDGRYTARGLRVGGPYTVLVLKDGFQSKSTENVTLKLAQTANVSMALEPLVAEMEAVEVVAAAQSDVFSPDKIGAGTNVDQEQLAALPSIQRSIQDYARLDPRVSQSDKQFGAISAMGQNNRFNQITIDGVTVNDTFGLQANNLPLLRQPVSMDAIEELNISINNYDVTQKGYTGAGINAVTKSGTNDYDGSVYYIYRDGEWGRKTDDRGVFFQPFDDQETYGGTFGGPLIEDRLFFFVAYEKFERSSPAPDVGGLVGVTPAQAQQAIQIAQTYGIDAGDSAASALPNEVEEYLVKLDWNINDYHRANLRYTNTEQNQIDLARLGGNRLALSSAWFNRLNSFESYVGQLFSDWTDSFSTEAKVSFREFLAEPQPFSRLPQIQISTGAGQIALGTEQFRHANLLTTETWNGYFAGNLYAGDHDIKFGLDYENNDIYNLFLESSLGNYGFASLADFAAGRYSSYLLRLPTDGNLDSAAAAWTLNNTGGFAQDTWSFSPNLTLIYGFRVDIPDVPDRPVFNAAASTFFGQRNDTTIDGNTLVQPRFGFNYTFDWERPAQLRGGVGLFQGAAANVWLSNPFTNNGRTISVFGCGTAGLPACTGTLPPFSVDPDDQPLLSTGATTPSDVDIVDGDLEQPSVWKANLAFEHELPWWGLVGSAEIILLSTEQSVHYEHLNLGNPTGLSPDGRLMYWNPAGYNPASWNQNGAAVAGSGVQARFNRNRDYREVLLAKPTSKGDAQSLTVSLQKPQTSADDPWYWQVGYTFTDAHDVNQLAGSISVENWSSRVSFNPNEEISSRSSFAIRDRFTGVASWRHFFWEGYKTEVGMFYEGRRGRPYSYVFDNDANGDGIAGNDLLYIPGQRGDVLFGSAAEENAFWAYLENNEYLSSHRGQLAGRNDSFSSWTNQFDVRISQELPGIWDDHKAEIWLDILNIGNLINKDWGHVDEVFVAGFGSPQGLGIVEYGGVDAASGRYVYRFNTPDAEVRRDLVGESRWALQVGIRYEF